MNNKSLPLLAAIACAMAFSAAHAAEPKTEATLDCKLSYSLSGWSLIYKHTVGKGTVTCENGKSMPVRVSAKAVGLTVGKWRIDDGNGKFTDVHKIEDVLGHYATASANLGVAKSGSAQVLSNGKATLALAGVGKGVNIGVDIGDFEIEADDVKPVE